MFLANLRVALTYLFFKDEFHAKTFFGTEIVLFARVTVTKNHYIIAEIYTSRLK